MEYLFRGIRAATAQLSSEVKSIKCIKSEMIMRGVNSQKDLPHEIRLGIAKPFFEKSLVEHNNQPIPFGSDLGSYFNLVGWFGKDVIASLIDGGLIEPEFDFADRDKKNVSLSIHLRKLAKEEGWKE